jgi:hypothetical protein
MSNKNHIQEKRKSNIFVRCKTGETESRFVRRGELSEHQHKPGSLLASPWENQEKIITTNCSIWKINSDMLGIIHPKINW